MKARAVICLLALGAAGCGSIPTSTEPITEKTGQPVPAERIYQRELAAPSPGRTATALFLRDAGFLGGGCTHRIYVDGKLAFAIRAGEYQRLYLAPGRPLLALEIEGGICPYFFASANSVLKDGAENTYRILIGALYSALSPSTPIGAGSPQVMRIDAATGKPMQEF